jgi:gamma-tubulin complex component 5
VDPQELARRFVVPLDLDGAAKLQQVKHSQAWRTAPSVDSLMPTHRIALNEFTILRESLFMLHGVKTTLFDDDCTHRPAYQLENVAWETYSSLIKSYSDAGRGLKTLRLFVLPSQQRASPPHWQMFQDCILNGLADIDREITKIETRLAAPQEDTVISMMATFNDLKPRMEPLLALSGVVSQLLQDATNTAASSFRHLELLFEDVTMAQLTGQSHVYEFLARVFFESFQAYLCPVRMWMEEGRLLPGDELFFVSRTPGEITPAQMWSLQFTLRRTADGSLHAPSFLRPNVKKIFTAGKSIVVLKKLGKFEVARKLWKQQDEPSLAFDTVCRLGHAGWELTPFPELFGLAFDAWIQSKHHATSSTLKRILFDSCGLGSALDALERVYFMQDGAFLDEQIQLPYAV